jgi:hypothetical protein
MAKTDRIQHKMVAVMCDGVQLHRVQRFGASSDLPQEQTVELSNSGVVEYKKGIPDVTVTLETNESGSNDILSLVADKMIVKSQTPAANSTPPLIGTYRWAVKAASSNSLIHSVNAQDFLDCYCDFTVPVTEDNTSVTRTMWIHRAGLSGVNWAFDANGYASENYQFKASNKRWFANAWAGVRVAKLYPNNATSMGGGLPHVSFNFTGSAMPSGCRPLYYAVNEKVYACVATSLTGVTGVPNLGDGNVRMATSGWKKGVSSPNYFYVCTSVAGGIDTAAVLKSSLADIYVLYLASSTWNQYPTWSETARFDTSAGYLITSTSGAFGGSVRGNYKMWLTNTNRAADTTTDANQTLRLQNVSIDISLTTDQLLQLGQHKPYGISRQVPVPVNVTVTANDSDLALFAGGAATTAGQAKTVGIEDFNGKNQLTIEVYRDIAKTTKLRTFVVTNMSVTGENIDNAVNSDGSQEITFTADNIRVFGANTGTLTTTNVTGY